MLEVASGRIGPEYFQLPVADADAVYRERVYCYELYHQLRCVWEHFPLSLGGEVDKSKQRMAGRDYRRCLCPIWVDGSLNGIEMRKSLRLRDWQRAQELVRKWEADGQRIETPKPLSVKEACDKFLSDAEARNLREPTLYKYRLLFRQLQDFAVMHGLPCINDFDIDWARRFRGSWKNKNISARKKLEAFRAFFRFVHESGWIPTNPASHLNRQRLPSRRPPHSRERRLQAS